jgi:hypothetical protein
MAADVPEDFTTRERRVDEEADCCIRQSLTDEARSEEQVVVVYPDEITLNSCQHHRVKKDTIALTWLVHALDGLGKGLVDGGVSWPVRVCAGVLCRNVLPQEVVEQRPECCVCITLAHVAIAWNDSIRISDGQDEGKYRVSAQGTAENPANAERFTATGDIARMGTRPKRENKGH